MPSLYNALGVYLPLITTNCAVLGVALNNVQDDYNILEGVVNGFATGVGYLIAIVLLAGIREKMEYNDIPESFKGMPIVLLTSGTHVNRILRILRTYLGGRQYEYDRNCFGYSHCRRYRIDSLVFSSDWQIKSLQLK